MKTAVSWIHLLDKIEYHCKQYGHPDYKQVAVGPVAGRNGKQGRLLTRWVQMIVLDLHPFWGRLFDTLIQTGDMLSMRFYIFAHINPNRLLISSRSTTRGTTMQYIIYMIQDLWFLRLHDTIN